MVSPSLLRTFQRPELESVAMEESVASSPQGSQTIASLLNIQRVTDVHPRR